MREIYADGIDLQHGLHLYPRSSLTMHEGELQKNARNLAFKLTKQTPSPLLSLPLSSSLPLRARRGREEERGRERRREGVCFVTARTRARSSVDPVSLIYIEMNEEMLAAGKRKFLWLN